MAPVWSWQTEDEPEDAAAVEPEAVEQPEPVAESDAPVWDWRPEATDEQGASEPAIAGTPIAETSAFANWDWEASDEGVAEPEAVAHHGTMNRDTDDSLEESDDDAWAPEAYGEAPMAPPPATDWSTPPVAASEDARPAAWQEYADDEADAPPAAELAASPAAEAAEEAPTPWWEDADDEADAAASSPTAAELPAPAAEVPPPALEDDPWAAFMRSRGDVEGEAVSPAPADEAVEPEPVPTTASLDEDDSSNRWDDVFGSASEPAETEEPVARDAWGRPMEYAAAPAAEAEPAAPAPAPAEDDDPWSAITAASGYDTHDEDDVVQRGEPASEIIASLESKLAAAAAAEQSRLSAVPPPPPWASREETGNSAPPEDEPWQNDQDVVLRAFEKHAASAEPEPERAAPKEPETPLTTLFGEDAADIVGEDPEESRAFQRLQGWAPQKTARPRVDPANAPWEVDDETAEHDPTAPIPAWGRSSDGVAPPPPWAVDPEDGGELPIPAAQGQSKTKTLVRELVETGLLALLVFLAVRASFQNFKVDGSSMSPTLHDGQFLIVNKLIYSEVNVDKLSNFIPFLDPGNEPERNVFHGPERGDIVVLVDPRKPDTDLIKRVIGLPGESLQIVDGRVYINDHLLNEPYIKTPWHDNKEKITIPADEYFVMGDNRDNSLDSRSQQVGLVPKDLIIGKAMLSYWPSDAFGLAPNGSPTISETETVPHATVRAIDP